RSSWRSPTRSRSARSRQRQPPSRRPRSRPSRSPPKLSRLPRVDADPRLTAWVDGYVRAWNSNDPQDIGALFADDATYRTEPFSEPWRGRAEIVERWLERKDEPGNSEFAWKPLAATDDVAIVE